MASYFVTGISSGIGNAFTRLALSHGHRVTGISRRVPTNLDDNARLQHWQFDLSDLQALDIQFRQCLMQATQNWTTVILNAAELGPLGDLSSIHFDQLSHMFNTNLWANKVLLDAILAGDSCVNQVIAITSGAATEAKRGLGGYCLSKATLNMLIQVYALEYPHVHFSCILPGTVDTEMQQSLCHVKEDKQFPVIKALKQKRADGRLSSSDEVALQLLTSADALRWMVKSGGTLHIESLNSNLELMKQAY